MSAKLVVLIEKEARRGLGKNEDDPIRIVREWYTPEGEFVVAAPDRFEKKDPTRLVPSNG